MTKKRTCRLGLKGLTINHARILSRVIIPDRSRQTDSFRHETLHMLSHHGAARAHRAGTRPLSRFYRAARARPTVRTQRVHATGGKRAFTRLQPRARRSGGAMPPYFLLSLTVYTSPPARPHSVALGAPCRPPATPASVIPAAVIRAV